jgi:predicted aspartyl protease
MHVYAASQCILGVVSLCMMKQEQRLKGLELAAFAMIAVSRRRIDQHKGTSQPWVMVIRQIQQVQVMRVPLREALAQVLLAKAPQAREAQAALQLQSDLTSLTSVRGTQAQSVKMCLATSASAPSDQPDKRQ